MIKLLSTTLLFLLIITPSFSRNGDKLLQILKQELTRQKAELDRSEYAPYYMNYRVIDRTQYLITASFGAINQSRQQHSRTLVPQIRLGNEKLDNFKYTPMGAPLNRFGQLSYAQLPLDEENNEAAILQAIWNETNNRYKFAVDNYQKALAQSSVNVEEKDKSPYFSPSPSQKYYEEPPATDIAGLDIVLWEKRMKELSAVFKQEPHVLKGNAIFSFIVERRYFIDSEGTEVVQNLTYCRVMLMAETKADDGMELPLNASYFAYLPDDITPMDVMLTEAKEIVKTLKSLRESPVADPYTGPALLSGSASGVFFHEIFGHRVEGLRMKSESDGQTFKEMVGQSVLPADFQVFDDPTLKEYRGEQLNGFYKYDEQGVKAERVAVVADGKLKDFLMTRTPIDGHPRSNGHARATDAFDPVSRQSNLIIETKSPKTKEELRKLLKEETQKQGKEYGYFFEEVTSGLTFTAKGKANSFNVTPLVVYKVYVDGRPDELVRGVELIGTPLSMFSNISYAGNDPEIFTGMCGAESGSIPVTAISPIILVNKVETQIKAKSQALPPILPKPVKK